MPLAYETNVDLAFDTAKFREYGKVYADNAETLLTLAKNLNDCLTLLAESGWTTQAGTTFQKMAEVNWEDNINKYANLLIALDDILNSVADIYDDLAEKIEATKLQ